MRATGNKVFLEREEYKSANGIIAPHLAKQGMGTFKVAAVGPGEWNVFTGEMVPMSVKVGDRVVADIAVAPEIEVTKGLKKTKYYIVAESQIQMVLDDEEVGS